MKNKLYSFLVVFLFLSTNTVKGESYNNGGLDKTKITINLKSESFFKVFSKIELLTNYSFLYKSEIIDSNKKISINVKNKSISFILNNILEDENIIFKLIGNNIALKKTSPPLFENHTIKGKVINAITKEVIPYCNIVNKNNYKGTFTNEEGEFAINVSSLPVNLIFSHLNFKTKQVTFSTKNEITITLNPIENILDAVNLSNTKEELAIKLVKKSFKKINSNYKEKKYAKAFYRQKTKSENKYYEFSEIFFDVIYNTNGVLDWEIFQGRYALKNEKLNNRNFTHFSKILKATQPETNDIIFPLNLGAEVFYKTSITEIIKSEKGNIAVLWFKPLKNITTPIFEGEVYINMQTFNTLKVIGTLKNDSAKLVGFSDKKASKKDYSLIYELVFKEDTKDELKIDYIKIDQQFYYYKNNVKINKVETSSLLTFYEHSLKRNKTKNQKEFSINKGDWKQLDNIEYNELFWKNNPIVKRTPIEKKVIKDFEKDYAFNNLFLNRRKQISITQNNISQTPYIKNLNEKTRSYNKENIYEKLYIKTNKDVFFPNEKIFFSSYLTHGSNHTLTNSSNVLYIELLSSENKKVATSQEYIFNGRGKSSFLVPPDLSNGKYQLRAYTNWMKNFDQGHYFKKNIEIIGSKKKVNGNYINSKNDLVFFPEGGHIIENKNGRVAFKINNYQNSKKQVKGEIIDSKGNSIINVITKYNGKGYFNLKPEKGETYRLILENKKQYDIPKSKKEGYTVFVNNLNDDLIKIKISASKNLLDKPFYLFGHMYRDRYLQGKYFFGKQPYINIDFPKQNLPTGLLTLTILDENKIPWAERAVYVNNEKTLNINVKNKVEKIEKGKKVTLKINTTTYNGIPAASDLSIAVINKDLVSKDHNSSNIVSHLLLESELKNQIKDPFLFIKDKSRPTKGKIDLLMLTNGWRSYNWKEIKSGIFPLKEFKREKNLTISGLVKNFNSSLLRNTLIKAIVKSKKNLKIYESKTDNNGKFKIEDFNHFGDTEIVFEAIVNNKKTNQIRVVLDKINTTPLDENWLNSESIKSYKYVISEKEKIKIINNEVINFKNKYNELDEVIVKGKKRRQQSRSLFNVVPSSTVYMEDLPAANNVFDVLERTPGVRLYGTIISLGPTNTDPLIILDGAVIFGGKGGKRISSGAIPAHYNMAHPLFQINLGSIERIEILRGNNSTIFGARGLGGVILMYSKRGKDSKSKKTKKPLSQFIIKGYTLNKEFPASNFKSIESYKGSSNSTISWHPILKTDKNGNAIITFFTTKENINYQVVIDALSTKGVPGFFMKDYTLE